VFHYYCILAQLGMPYTTVSSSAYFQSRIVKPWHTFSYSSVADQKVQAGIKIAPCGGESRPHNPAEKGERAVSWEESSTASLSVLGLARTGLIFTGLQEGAQPGGGG